MIPEIEKSPLREIEIYQVSRLRETLQYVAERSPFYKRLFASHSIEAKQLKDLSDLQRIPTTSKDDLQKHNWDFLCVPKEQIIEYTSTSGTLGKPVTIALTAGDLDRLAYNEAISFACADGHPSDLYQLMLTLDRQFMAGIAYYEGIRKLGAGLVRVGPGLPSMQWETIERLRPTALVAVPSFLVKLVEYAEEHKIDLRRTSVSKAICIGEGFRESDFQLNSLGRKIADHWNLKLFSTYASTEMQTAFTECSAGRGGHHHPELIIIEILDDKGQPVANSRTGELTITTLGVEGMPLIRYRTGDMVASFDEPCSCGRTTMRLGPIAGRKQQMIKLKGTTLYPLGVFEILNSIDAVKDYVVEAFSNELDLDELRLHVFTNGDSSEQVRSALTSSFQSRLRVVPSIEFVSGSDIERMQMAPANRKLTRFIDRRTASVKKNA